MKISTDSVHKKRGWLAVLFWLAVWQGLSLAVGQKILLASPVDAALALFRLLPEADFWTTVGRSFCRIALGFLLAAGAGVLLGIASTRSEVLRTLLSPLLHVIKATPVASFIIVALIWVPSRGLATFISFLMVFPVLYLESAEAVAALPRETAEMARVFRVPFARRLRYFYLPTLLPRYRAVCSAALGLAFKAGIAAEVIGIPSGSLGEKLYTAKIYLNTPELFAWTAVIVLLSAVTEKVVLRLLRLAEEKGGRM